MVAAAKIANREDAAYIAHACNAYPALVAIVYELVPLARVGIMELGEGDEIIGRANKLLNDLGEDLP